MPPSRSSSSSTLMPASRDSDTSSIRPRNRRLLSTQHDGGSSSSLVTPSRTPSRGASPIPQARIGSVTGRNNAKVDVVQSPNRGKNTGLGRGLLDGSWTPSWASVQELASSLLTGGEPGADGDSHHVRGRDGSRPRRPTVQTGHGKDSRSSTWGPAPPSEGRPRADDIGAGSRAEREAALKAMRTASVLESHEGVNGGLDVARRFKKRSSDEDLRSTSENQETEEYLAYIHHVQKSDTYAGIVLKYRCREDAFRKANGLWSRDNIQVRKWLAIPVDACEVRGRPCDPPTNPSSRVDLLSKTPDATDPFGADAQQTQSFFPNNSHDNRQEQTQVTDDSRPWTNVRWVSIDSHPHPVEVARVPRKSLGYFPPRRKKSVHTLSTLSSPRVSNDLPNAAPSESAVDSPRSASSRRPSVLTSQRLAATTSNTPNRSRINSTGSSASADAADPRPAWMRRPGGVGSMGRHVRAPGPERDYFNTWTNKHIPGLNIDSLPSMSVMGSEIARFGFHRSAETSTVAIAESPFEDGRDASNAGKQQGTGLDKAAMAVETWLRGAFERARQGPLTPVLGPRGGGGRPGGGMGAAGMGPAGVGVGGVGGGAMMPDVGGDLIELTDTGSDDGRHSATAGAWGTGDLLGSLPSAGAGGGGDSSTVSGSRPEQWNAGVRGRNKKAD